jgi:hypothetical protein
MDNKNVFFQLITSLILIDIFRLTFKIQNKMGGAPYASKQLLL